MQIGNLGRAIGGNGSNPKKAPPGTLNLVTYPESMDQWTAVGATIVRNAVGGSDRMVETSNLSQHSLTNPISISFEVGKTYTLSIEFEYENAPFIQLLFGSAAFGANAWGNFDGQLAALGTMGSGAAGAVDDLGGGRCRVSITATATASAAAPIAIFAANAADMTRAASYTGSTSNTRLLTKVQVEQAPAMTTYIKPVRRYTGNPGAAIVGAIRWDAWHHPTPDTIRSAVETSLGPSQYHWRLPFFATEPTPGSAIIAGDQTSIDDEIGYAVRAGLDYWAFFWYGLASTNGMRKAWDYYQESPRKAEINWCLYFSGVAPFDADITNNLATIIGYLQQPEYQKTASGRPLVFMFDDSASKTNLAANITAFRNAATGASLQDPYIVFHQSTPSAAVLSTYGLDATTTYAPIVSVSGAKPFNLLDTAARSVWAAQAAQNVDVVPSFTMGWDRRPRVENPVPWEGGGGSLSDYYYLEDRADVSTHIDAVLAWARANQLRTPENIVIGYAWNENDEGGWITPTRLPGGGFDISRVKALRSVLT